MQDIRIGDHTLDDSDNVTRTQVKGGTVITYWELKKRMPPDGILEINSDSGHVALAAVAVQKRLKNAGLACYLGRPVRGVRVTSDGELEMLYCSNDSISHEYHPMTLIGLYGVIRMLRERESEALVEVTFTRREV